MGFENLFGTGFETLQFPVDANMVYIIGVQDDRKGFFPFYVGKTRRLIGRMGDYDNAHFDPLPDFHVGQAIKCFHLQKRNVVVKYKLSKAMSAEEGKW